MAEPLKVFCRKCNCKLDVSELEPFSKFRCPDCGVFMRVPKRFDEYLLEKIVGIGGISKVYRAIDVAHKCRVAVKIIEPEFIDDGMRERLLEEARIVGHINAPGIIPVYKAGVCETRPFLVMQYLPNGSLELKIKHGTLEPRQTLGWLLTVGAALKAALDVHIVHHDVKPGNVLLDAGNQAYLGDFDLAEMQISRDQSQPCTGWASPGYVSPERLYDGTEDYRGDIFSFGVSAYELLTGVAPFGHEAEEAQLLLARREKSDYEPLCRLQPQVSEELSGVIGRMMSLEPYNRPEYPEIIESINRELEPERRGASHRGFWRKLAESFGWETGK